MHARDPRVGARLLARAPVYSAVAIAGLALGFAVCYLLLGFVRYSFSYDSAVPDRARVFVLQHKVNLMPAPSWIEFMPLPFQDAARRSGLALRSSAAIPREVVLAAGNVRWRGEVTAVDADFVPLFGLTAREGDLAGALARPDGLVLTASAARQLFGAAAALGRTVTAGDTALRVMAVVADAPSNTTMPYTALVGRGSALWSGSERAAARAQWQGLGGKIYLRLRDGASAADMTRLLQEAADQSPWRQMAPTPADRARLGHVIEVRLRTLSEAYFDTEVARGYRGGQRGERPVVLALAAVAVLVLALAAANYLNLATVRTLGREREIGVRKAIGAGRAQLVRLLMAESVLVTTLAYGAGLLLAWLALPPFAELIERRLEGVFAPVAVLAGLAGALLLGVASALYPAWIALRVRPLAALVNARYLAHFVERAPMGWWPLAIALLLAVAVAGAATARHLHAALRAAPARLLRD